MLLHNRSTTPQSLPHTSCMLFLALARRSCRKLRLLASFIRFSTKTRGEYFHNKKKAVFDSLIRFLRELKVTRLYSCIIAPPRRGHCRIPPVCSSSHLLGVPLGFNSRDFKKKLSSTA